MVSAVARHELRSLLGAAQPDRRLAAINGDFPIELSDSRIVIAQADIKSRRGGGPIVRAFPLNWAILRPPSAGGEKSPDPQGTDF